MRTIAWGSILLIAWTTSQKISAQNLINGTDFGPGTTDFWYGWSSDFNDQGTAYIAGAPKTYVSSETGMARVFQETQSGWIQKGGTLQADAFGNFFGVSVSLNKDATRVVVGDFLDSETHMDAGAVTTFSWKNGAWVKTIGKLNGTSSGERLGAHVILNGDGSRLAVSSYRGTSVYDLVGNVWTQIGSTLLNGKITGAVQFSQNGNTLVLAHEFGKYSVFDFDGTSWLQRGATFTLSSGFAENHSANVSISDDGMIIALGADHEDSPTATDVGSVKVFFYFNNQWIQFANTLYGNHADQRFGHSVSLSGDGLLLAIGAEANRPDPTDPQSPQTGAVQAFMLSNNNFTPVGNTLYGLSAGPQSLFGNDIELSKDGNRLLVSAPYHNLLAGYNQVYDYDNTLSIHAVNMDMEAIVYPNPTSEWLTIDLGNHHSAGAEASTSAYRFAKAQIINLQGQVVFESDSQFMDVSSLATGTYLVQVRTVDGSVQTKRFVKR